MIDWLDDHWMALLFGATVLAFWVLPMAIYGVLACG
jgi:hypothetical protein